MEIKPNDHEAWNNRGIFLQKLRRYEAAIASYDKALAIKPGYEIAKENRRITVRKLNSPLNRVRTWLQK
ncbi:MAG: tetratricopeptide repeat protein [Leptolyngbyaceae cyanobacterium]